MVNKIKEALANEVEKNYNLQIKLKEEKEMNNENYTKLLLRNEQLQAQLDCTNKNYNKLNEKYIELLSKQGNSIKLDIEKVSKTLVKISTYLDLIYNKNYDVKAIMLKDDIDIILSQLGKRRW